ncbi:hypothetical protein PIB30_049123 [Stylosanthes scabra]|uniref:Uncharacterized protein n=1 Tax=Stylosanthes scabra TaxID=79078 RepID=A0ABU6VFL4_9FABA|nr:hypothetical protein [Stylosanthes scabra]
MHFGPPPWVDVEEFLNSIEVSSSLVYSHELPFKFCKYGWWNVIGSQYGMAIFGYAFGYTPNTDQYYVVHVGDILVHKLGYHNVVHAGKAWWIDWVGPEFVEAKSIISFDLQSFEFKKTKIPKKARKIIHYLIVCDENLCFASHDCRLSGWETATFVYSTPIADLMIRGLAKVDQGLLQP